MQIWIYVRHFKAKEFAESQSNDFASVRDAVVSSRATSDKIKQFVLSRGGCVFLNTDFEIVVQIAHSAVEELEALIEGYNQGYQIAVGLGTDYNEAKKAVKVSECEGGFQFYDRSKDCEPEESPFDQNNIANKKRIEEKPFISGPSIEESIQNKEGYLSAVAAAQAEKIAPMLEQQAMQQAQAAEEQQAQIQAQAEQVPQDDQDPRAAMFEEAQAEPEQKSEDKIELDATKSDKSEDITNYDMRYKIAGLLATIRENTSEFAKLRQQDPETFEVVSKLVSSAIKLAKSVKNDPEALSKMEINKEKLKESLKKAFPLNFIKDGKMKIKDPLTGRTRWRGVRTGLMQDDDGAAISTKVHNKISRENELGKDESYQGGHAAPTREYGKPLHDLTDVYPDDLYSDQGWNYYGHGDKMLDQGSTKIISAFRGKPTDMVKMYRAVPNDPNITSINRGDWVTINKDYAKKHGEAHVGDYKILEQDVPASHLYSDGNSIHEWGYDPEENDLEKMSQPTIRTPNLKNINTRPDQEVTPIATKRQKEIFSRSANNNLLSPTTDEDRINKRLRSTNRILSDKKVLGMVLNSQSRPDAKKTHQAMYHVGDRRSDSTQEHEAAHFLFKEVQAKYGEPARQKLVHSLINELGPDVANDLKSFVRDYRKYKVKSPGFGEELLNHARDILTDKGRRLDYVIHHSKGDHKQKISDLKAAWKRVTQKAKSIRSEDLE